jgi:phosphoglycolate phosphatase-like HAD superfamily hydrolase
MIRALFFDFDGVILESVGAKTEAFAELFEDFPEHVDQIVEYHLENAGVSRFDKFRYIYGNLFKQELTNNRFNALCEEFSKIVFQKVLDSEYVTGVREFIQDYYRKYDMFIVSATPHDEIKEICKQLSLDQYFKDVLGSPRPKGQWVNMLMEQYGYKANESVFIGDAMSDYKAADENGILFIGRIRENKNSPLSELILEQKIRNFNGFEHVLNEINMK